MACLVNLFRRADYKRDLKSLDMAVCRLTYFNFKALGEPIRLLLTYGGVQFEDIRIDRFGQEWVEKKPSFPFAQLPVLEIDGLHLNQSKAISRYLGRKFDLAGSDDKESIQIDIIVDAQYDFIMKLRTVRDELDPVRKEEKYNLFLETVIPFYLGKLNHAAQENNGHMACKKLTWADFYFAGMDQYLSTLCRFNITEKYSHLKAVCENVNKIPELKEHIANRPHTDV